MCLGLLALIFASMDAMKEMLRFWETREEYSHGYLIPFIAAFLIWQRSDILRNRAFSGSWLGLPVVFAGVAFILIGSLTTIAVIGQYGFFFAILGLALAYLGWKGLKPVLVPLLFLVFMIPFPGFFLNNLSSKLQLISSEIGVAVIRAFDISVYLEGNVIDLGNYKLQVVEACSGLNYLFPLMSLAFITAYFFKAPFWQRAVVFLSSIPITVFMNSFRIGVIGVLVEYWGIEQAEGFLHDFEGWVIFMACMALLFLEMWLFIRFSKEKRPLKEVFGMEFPEPAPEDASVRYQKASAPFIISLVLVCLSALAANQIQARQELVPERRVFAEFPLEIGDWKGKGDSLESIILDALKLDDYVIADYVTDKGNPVNFYAAYYASQRAGESAHSPRSCLPGGGWIMKEIQQIVVPGAASSEQPVHVNRVVIKKGEYTQLVYYWFQQRGRSITNEYLVKWYLLLDAINKNRTDGALVRLTTLVRPGQDIAEADALLMDFTAEVLPYLADYIPN
ncbi:MAG: VPLPA-CTERM-specific exosortase XrtD [Gammaproteobacteria bacterium]|nr:VPLPA-CTERM-specific exosortase XrtD [Gammaproteobacteria bacterium]